MNTRCRCGCDEKEHEMKNDILKCTNSDNPYHCEEFIEDDMCECGHYKSSHDWAGRCHFVLNEEDMCECDKYAQKERK